MSGAGLSGRESGRENMPSNNFYFLGGGPLSKSLLNRALIVKSWFPDFAIKGSSACGDIQIMEKAVARLKTEKEFFCGLSGSALRFLAVRLSRERGEFFLRAAPALMARPLHELSGFLAQLGASGRREKNGWRIVSEGWRPQGDCICVPSQTTSQYASALALSGWNLERDLWFSLGRGAASPSYFQMTMDFLRGLGMEIKESGLERQIPKGQRLKVFEYKPERDKSCLFVLGALAALKGRAIFTSYEKASLQPDAVFPEILRAMGVSVERKGDRLSVSRAGELKPVSMDLELCPDLFPVLAVLCAKAGGESRLSGLRRLAFKESNRLKKTRELLRLAGIKTSLEGDALLIYGQKEWSGRGGRLRSEPAVFDTAQDHRMAMAGELARQAGAALAIQGKEAARKSFPDFFALVK